MEYDLAVIPRTQNVIANSIVVSASTCKIPHPNKPHTIEIKHHPPIPDNMRYWQVFRNDKQIEIFLLSKDEFEET